MNISIIYFNFPFWRAEVSRIALDIGKIKYNDIRIDRDEFTRARSTGQLDDGTVISCDDAEGRTNLIKAVPGIMGAHAGCNWEARRQCHKDVVSFFKKEFLNS